MKTLSRRDSLKAAMCASAVIWSGARAAETVRVGQTAAYSGAFGELGSQFSVGIKMALDQANAAAGAPRFEWSPLDDQSDPNKALDNARKLLDEKKIHALLGVLGTGVNKALMPFCEERHLPLFALTGDDGVRQTPQRYTFFSSASYGDEARNMVFHGATVGKKSVFVIHTDFPAGKGWADDAKAAAEKNKVAFNGAFATKPDGSNAAQAVKAFLDSKADFVAMVYAGAGVKMVIEGLQAAKVYPGSIYLLSQGATPSLIEQVRSRASGLSVSQVVPNPFASTSPLMAQYLAALKSAQGARNYLTYQGYLLGRAFIDAVARIGSGAVHSASLVAALEQAPLRYGAWGLDYTGGKRTGTHWGDISMLRADGRFVS